MRTSMRYNGRMKTDMSIFKRAWGVLLFRGAMVLLPVMFLLPGSIEAVFADYEGDLDEALPRRALSQYRYLKAHFEAPFDGYSASNVVIDQFAVVFLSHAALGFLNVALSAPLYRDEALSLLTEVYRRASLPGVSPFDVELDKVGDFDDNNMYLSHVNLIIGAECLLSRNPSLDAVHKRISTHLAAKSLADKTAHARSYPDSPRFPADQAALLASLHLYDRCHGTALSKKPIEKWLRYMADQGKDKGRGLPISSVSPGFKNHRLPRGCALSWTTLYMTQFAPEQSYALYSQYRKQFYTHFAGWGGFREYPPGIERAMDVDSGPIIAGMGVAATGLGLGAARLFHDRRTYVSIMRTAASIGMPPLAVSGRYYLLSPLLGEAILFHGITARRWDGLLETHAPLRASPPLPVGALLLLSLVLAFTGYNLLRLVRLIHFTDD